MIFLPVTTGKIQVVTSAAGAIHTHASFADVDAASAVTVGYENNVITTAATTDVVDPPTGGKTRNIKSLFIGNAHASVTNTVTIQHTDGTTTVELEKVTLLPGERISFREGVPTRVVNANGIERTAADSRPYFNANTADVVANAADTYLAGSSIPFGGRPQAGAHLKWRLRATKTAAGTAAPVFNIRVGTAGTTADTGRVTFTQGAQSAAVDTAQWEIDAVCRSIGATGTLQGSLVMWHNLAATGFSTAAAPSITFLQTLSAGFDMTVANSVIGLSVNPGASGVWTFQVVSVEANGLLP